MDNSISNEINDLWSLNLMKVKTESWGIEYMIRILVVSMQENKAYARWLVFITFEFFFLSIKKLKILSKITIKIHS